MTRWKLTIEYDGRGHVGWQRQAAGWSIQGRLEAAVEALTGEVARVSGSGRTDAGVHALGQVGHLDIAKPLHAGTVRGGLNHHLRMQDGPSGIVVLDAAIVAGDFDARRSAIGRAYRFRILNRRAPPALDRGRVWYINRGLDVGAMADAAALLLGRHDFSSFRAVQCQALSPIRTLDRLDVRTCGDEIVIEAEARSFLHNQIRIIAGTLAKVGDGSWPVERVAEALAARDRVAAGPTAPPDGLYLIRIDYP